MTNLLTPQIGTTISPYIVELGGESNPGLPPAVFGAVMMLGSLAFLFLPETKDLPFIQSTDDMKRQEYNSIVKRIFCGRGRNRVRGTDAMEM